MRVPGTCGCRKLTREKVLHYTHVTRMSLALVCQVTCTCEQYCTSFASTSTVLYDSLWRFKCMYCVDFAENALFSSSGDIYSGLLLSTIGPSLHAPWQLSMDRMNNSRLLSRYKISTNVVPATTPVKLLPTCQ